VKVAAYYVNCIHSAKIGRMFNQSKLLLLEKPRADLHP